MKHRWFAAAAALITSAFVASIGAVDPGISLVGMGLVPGTDLDKSGLAGQSICRIEDGTDCIDQATLGGFGSALAYTGFDSVFVTVPDRGPFDGRTDVPYRDRFHFMHLTVDPSAAFPNITTTLLDTRFMKAHGNEDMVGSSAEFAARFDPEGVAIGRNGSFFVSDEYGPAINEFNREGHLRRIAVPGPSNCEPSGDGQRRQFARALSGAQHLGPPGCRGMEGLAISPDASIRPDAERAIRTPASMPRRRRDASASTPAC